MNPNPSFPPPVPGGAPPPAGPPASELLNVPAILLMAGAGVGVLVRLAALAGLDRVLLEQLAKNPQYSDLPMMTAGGGVGTVVAALVLLALNALIIFGAMKMRAGQSYTLALTAAILGAIPYCGCYPLSMTGGIWALVLLLKPEVKAQFTA